MVLFCRLLLARVARPTSVVIAKPLHGAPPTVQHVLYAVDEYGLACMQHRSNAPVAEAARLCLLPVQTD